MLHFVKICAIIDVVNRIEEYRSTFYNLFILTVRHVLML